MSRVSSFLGSLVFLGALCESGAYYLVKKFQNLFHSPVFFSVQFSWFCKEWCACNQHSSQSSSTTYPYFQTYLEILWTSTNLVFQFTSQAYFQCLHPQGLFFWSVLGATWKRTWIILFHLRSCLPAYLNIKGRLRKYRFCHYFRLCELHLLRVLY